MTTDQPDAVVLCPYCPMCGQPPAFLLLLEQTFCLNDTCDVFCWDMTVSAQRNLSEMGQVESFGTMKDGRTWDTRRGDPHPED